MALGDPMYGLINPRCCARTPMEIPTWRHIGQMCLAVAESDWCWERIMADRKAVHKSLASAPGSSDLGAAKPRANSDSMRYGLRPQALLLWAMAAVLRHNSFPRILEVMVNLSPGRPVVNYFDYSGRLIPEELAIAGEI